MMADEWIDIGDRLPDAGKRVLITNGAVIKIGYLSAFGGWFIRDEGYIVLNAVTHWMPLPGLPERSIEELEGA